MVTPELADKLFQIMDSSITIEMLEEWLAPRLRNYLTSPESDDSNVIAAIELGLAEMSNGIRTEDEFRQLLMQVISEQNLLLVSFSGSDILTTSASSSTPIQPQIMFKTPVVFSIDLHNQPAAPPEATR